VTAAAAAASATVAAASGVAATATCDTATEPALSKKEFRPFPVRAVEKLTHNVSRLRVGLPTPESETGMVTAGMLMVQGPPKETDGKPCAKPYTPTTLNSTKGYFDLVVKRYPPGPNGGVSDYVHTLKVGDTISVKGCYTSKKILANQYKHIGLIAGGSGLTPLLQIAQELLDQVEDTTRLTMIFCNATPDDVYLREELDELASVFPDRLKVLYAVDDTAGQPWQGLVGRVDAAMIAEHMPPPGDEGSMVMTCGPKPMVAAIAGPKTPDYKQGEVGGLLAAAGYAKAQVWKF
jgi:cytochrome-b5 reductase